MKVAQGVLLRVDFNIPASVRSVTADCCPLWSAICNEAAEWGRPLRPRSSFCNGRRDRAIEHNTSVLSLTCRKIAATLLLLIGVGACVAVVFRAEADSSAPSDDPPLPVVEENAENVPTDEIRHVSPPPSEVDAARHKATTAFAEAKRMERQADIEAGPGGIPPASAGDNGTFDEPPERSHQITAATMTGTDGLPPERSALLIGRVAIAPPDAPAEVERAISAANAIVGYPYVWGGGHGSWNDNGYDCSGAVSYALGGAGLLGAPLDSSALMRWGKPGPGKWLTVYANPGHAYAVVGGLRWDTVGEQRGTGPKWHANAAYPESFVARHPPGL